MVAQTLQELVSTAASRHPDRTAVTFASGSPVCLSYRDLSHMSSELSAALLEVLPPSCSPIIGLYCKEEVLLPVWILGILQCDAAYVPLDPAAPGLFSLRVMSQCSLKYCAVHTELLQQFQTALIKHVTVEVCVELPKFKLTVIQIGLLQQKQADADQTGAKTADGAALFDSAQSEEGIRYRNLAYVLHTSGTTGFPKTVRVPHKCILPNILHLRSLFQMSADDVVFLASPLTFDPSVVEIFLALSSGAQLLIVPTVIKKMPNKLAQVLFKDHKTTVLQVTPTLLLRFGHQILKDVLLSSGSSLRVLALGGEACPSPALFRSWRHQDNKTQIYNIYGITEVSCWACCYEMTESLLRSSDLSVESVPLGTPLMDTVLEVRDEDGRVVTQGEGQVFLGGENRVCLLNEENAAVPGTMRATGDWVQVENTQLYYLGRRDRMIKRHGKQVNLDSLQQLILGLSQVESCAVALHQGLRLIAFVVTSPSGHQNPTPTSSSLSVQQQAEQTTSVSTFQHHLSTEGDAKRLIVSQLSLLLPSHSVPDTVVLVPALPLTPHGKVDIEALMTIHEKQRRCLRSSTGDATKLKGTLQALWQDALGLPGDKAIDQESNFLFLGGDSLKALRFTEDILSSVGVSSPELLELIISGTFSDILAHVVKITQTQFESSSTSLTKSRKRHSDPPLEFQIKSDRRHLKAAEKETFRVIRRAADVMEINTRNPPTNEKLHTEKLEEKLSDQMNKVCLSLSWSSDTGRCVDASPVLLVQDGANQRSDSTKVTVFIGPHSHRLQALDLLSGNLLWERVLGDRIEASAAVSCCGSLVVVGCYDGCVCFLSIESGDTWWTFETGDAVKSSAAVDPLTGVVVVGSHDGKVYALNPQVRRCVWKRHCGGGAVFSSPHLHLSLRRVYVATLGGRLLCLNLDSGDILWSYSRNVPFFSSPNTCSGHVVIGSVDGNICCLDTSGNMLWEFLTQGPVFSSPCITPDHQRILCGSHDGRLYCLNSTDGSLVWTFQTTGRVYAAPCVFEVRGLGWRASLVGLTSTDGTVWILDAKDGYFRASFTLPGELFSSPVVWEGSLVIGCRNDYVYCLKITVQEKT